MRSAVTLPEGFTSFFWQSAAQEIGTYSLNMILLRAGLERLVAVEDSIPKQVPISPQEFSRFNRAMREYYGNGSRGLLIRIGRGSGQLLAQHLSFSCRLLVNWCSFLPKTWRVRRAISSLAGQMIYPGGGIVVSQAGSELLVTDLGSLASLGETAPQPICFSTIGLIRGVLGTVTSEELDVEEVSCKASGTEACQFSVRFSK